MNCIIYSVQSSIFTPMGYNNLKPGMQAVVADISCKQCTRILGIVTIKYYSFNYTT